MQKPNFMFTQRVSYLYIYFLQAFEFSFLFILFFTSSQGTLRVMPISFEGALELILTNKGSMKPRTKGRNKIIIII